MKDMVAAAGLILGVLSTVCLYLGTKELPKDIESGKREKEPEQQYRRGRRSRTIAGLVMLGVAFVLQLVALLF